MRSSVEFRDVSYEIGGRTILSGVSFSVEAGETLVLLGRSGSGKTTALKMTNGMLFPTSGQVFVEGKSTRDWDPIRLKRHIGYVIQEVGLFPHFTIARNVGLVPTLEGKAGCGRAWIGCSIWSGCRRRIFGIDIRASFRVGRGSAQEWLGRWPRSLLCCCSMSRLERSIR